jgi:ABC-type sugar transport system ATPase subunit
MQNGKLLSMIGIKKAFPGVQALKGVDFELNPGEVMALVGENGAGKSTLIKILAGVHAADEGEIKIRGELVDIPSPRHAQQLGVAVIYQELELAEHLSVAENIFVGREFRSSLGLIDFRQMEQESKKLLDELNVHVDPRTEVRYLNMARKQMVEIARALSMDAQIIVMDEPTSSLPTTTSSVVENEVEVLLKVIDQLRQTGKAIVYISHRMDEVFRISDRITVFRDGALVGVRNTQETNVDEIVSMMVGRELEDLYGKPKDINIGDVVLEVRNLHREGDLKNIHLNVRRGEILGVAGLIGAGRTDMGRAVFGVDPKDSGEIVVEGKPVRVESVRDAIDVGIGLVPEDRKDQGLFLGLGVRANISAGVTSKISRYGFIQPEKESQLAQHYIDELRIRTPTMEQSTRNLSGGNQQKVVLAKWMAVNPKVLILDEPTRGVDVGAKAEIYHLMHKMVQQGMAIIMISSELTEILGMSDRVVVMREGKMMGELGREEATEEKIMAYATGSAGG